MPGIFRAPDGLQGASDLSSEFLPAHGYLQTLFVLSLEGLGEMTTVSCSLANVKIWKGLGGMCR